VAYSKAGGAGECRPRQRHCNQKKAAGRHYSRNHPGIRWLPQKSSGTRQAGEPRQAEGNEPSRGTAGAAVTAAGRILGQAYIQAGRCIPAGETRTVAFQVVPGAGR